MVPARAAEGSTHGGRHLCLCGRRSAATGEFLTLGTAQRPHATALCNAGIMGAVVKVAHLEAADVDDRGAVRQVDEAERRGSAHGYEHARRRHLLQLRLRRQAPHFEHVYGRPWEPRGERRRGGVAVQNAPALRGVAAEHHDAGGGQRGRGHVLDADRGVGGVAHVAQRGRGARARRQLLGRVMVDHVVRVARPAGVEAREADVANELADMACKQTLSAGVQLPCKQAGSG